MNFDRDVHVVTFDNQGNTCFLVYTLSCKLDFVLFSLWLYSVPCTMQFLLCRSYKD